MGLNTTPRTWVAAEVVTAAEMNAEVRDALTGIQAAWTTYTPTLTGITLGNGTVSAQYQQIGKTIRVQILFTAGLTTTYSGNFSFSLPVTAISGYYGANSALGSAIVNPTGARTLASVVYSTTTTVVLISASGLVSATSPGTWTTTSGFGVTFEYQAA